MNIKQILAIFAGIFVVLLIVLLGLFIFRVNPLFGKKGTATIHDKTFTLQVVSSEQDKEKGLSGRSSLPDNQGMLFLFDKPDYYAFWMKNMKFPLDLIFLNGERVVTIYSDVQVPASDVDNPPVYKPEEPADKVLELNAGKADELNLKKGDTIDLSYDSSGN